MTNEEIRNHDATKYIRCYVLMRKEGYIALSGIMSLAANVQRKYNLTGAETSAMIDYSEENIDTDVSGVYVDWK